MSLLTPGVLPLGALAPEPFEQSAESQLPPLLHFPTLRGTDENQRAQLMQTAVVEHLLFGRRAHELACRHGSPPGQCSLWRYLGHSREQAGGSPLAGCAQHSQEVME